jgi:spore germination protein GerM
MMYLWFSENKRRQEQRQNTGIFRSVQNAELNATATATATATAKADPFRDDKQERQLKEAGGSRITRILHLFT